MIEKYSVFGGGCSAFSTNRSGGCSTGNYASFNANYFCNDDVDNVTENRRRLCAELGISLDNLIVPHQVHGTENIIVDTAFMSLPQNEQVQLLEGKDALITAEKGVCIAVSTADCVPVLLRDMTNNVVAAIHSGWRGTIANIIKATISTMQTEFSTIPSDIVAEIGPSISLNAFEVGNEVYDAFSKAGFPMDDIALLKDKWHIDLWQACKWQLMQCGVPVGNISVSGICTYTNYNKFFSARRLGINSGRILNGIILH